MAVVGRSSSGSGVEQLSANLATTITATDVGKVVYFNGTEFVLLTDLTTVTLTNSLIGVISAITLAGDGLGAQAKGFVTLRGTIQKAGALSGQVYFVGVGADLVLTPPADSFAIRVGFSRINNFLYVDLDPNTIQIAVLSQRLAALEATVDLISEAVLISPVYNFGSDRLFGINPDNTITNLGLDRNFNPYEPGYNLILGTDRNFGILE